MRLASAAVTLSTCLGASTAHAAVRFDAGSSDVSADVAVATVPSPVAHLPAWVQVAGSSAALYADDSGAAATSTHLGRFTFLHVLGTGKTRLQVQVFDANAQPGATGWVDPDDVVPTAPATDWRVTAKATPLFASADAGIDGARSVAAFTPLLQVGGPSGDRIQVRVYRSDFSGTADQGWVNVADTGPALPPQTRVAAPDGSLGQGARGPASATQQQAFLDAAAQAAIASRQQTGVPASVTVAQAILESDWGRSTLATGASNYFGVKALGGLGDDGVVWLPTSEFDANGQEYQTVSPFRAYKSLTDSMVDHDRLLSQLGRYAPAMQAANDPRQFAQLLMQGGYSTDPDYASKLIGLMDRYNLYQLDA